jgi:signal peptidase I
MAQRLDVRADGVGYVPFENLIGRAEVVFFSVGTDAPGTSFWTLPLEVRRARMPTLVH